MRRMMAALVAVLLAVVGGSAEAQERTYTVDELEQRCKDAPDEIVDPCLFLLYAILVPESGRVPPALLADPTEDPAGGKPGVDIHSFSGSTGKTTPAFQLHGGDYKLAWKGTDTSDYGCYFSASLEPADGGYLLEGSVSDLIDAGKTEYSETYIYALDAGRYYIDASNNSCLWTVTISPA